MNEKVTAVIKYHAVRHYPKIQRNDECPCGSRLKYKNCCQKYRRNPWKRRIAMASGQKEKRSLININH